MHTSVWSLNFEPNYYYSRPIASTRSATMESLSQQLHETVSEEEKWRTETMKVIIDDLNPSSESICLDIVDLIKDGGSRKGPTLEKVSRKVSIHPCLYVYTFLPLHTQSTLVYTYQSDVCWNLDCKHVYTNSTMYIHAKKRIRQYWPLLLIVFSSTYCQTPYASLLVHMYMYVHTNAEWDGCIYYIHPAIEWI